MASRSEMDAALRAVTVPRLKELGFTGTYPHLRKEDGKVFDLMTFQFDKHGGSLCVEMAKCLASGIDHPSLGHIPAAEATAHNRHPLYRKRLGSSKDGNESWVLFSDQDANAVAETIWRQLSSPNVWNDISPEGDEAPYRK